MPSARRLGRAGQRPDLPRPRGARPLRCSEKGSDVFIGAPQLTPELIRALAKVAGVHLFTEGKATVWAAEGCISLQAHETGPLVLNTGRQGKVVDALDGKALGDGPEVTLTLKKGEVRVIKYPKF